MRKILFLITLLVIIVLGLSSCSKDDIGACPNCANAKLQMVILDIIFSPIFIYTYILSIFIFNTILTKPKSHTILQIIYKSSRINVDIILYINLFLFIL